MRHAPDGPYPGSVPIRAHGPPPGPTRGAWTCLPFTTFPGPPTWSQLRWISSRDLGPTCCVPTGPGPPRLWRYSSFDVLRTCCSDVPRTDRTWSPKTGPGPRGLGGSRLPLIDRISSPFRVPGHWSPRDRGSHVRVAPCRGQQGALRHAWHIRPLLCQHGPDHFGGTRLPSLRVSQMPHQRGGTGAPESVRDGGPRHARIQRGGTSASRSVAEIVGTAAHQDPPTWRDRCLHVRGRDDGDATHRCLPVRGKDGGDRDAPSL